MEQRVAMVVAVMCVVWLSAVISSERNDQRRESSLYQVSLINKYNKLYCGGAVIRSNWIVTAGKCSFVCGDELMCAVRYGSVGIDRGRYAPIRIFAANPDYDIGLAESPMTMIGDIRVIPIYNSPLPYEASLTAVGWRWTKSPRMCQRKLRRARFRRVECGRNSSICAVSAERNTCFGDYGGSLVYQEKLVGISNFGLIAAISSDSSDDENGEIRGFQNGRISTRKVNGTLFQPRDGKVSHVKGMALSSAVGKGQSSRSGACRSLYPGYGLFIQVSHFVNWIERTIKNYTEEYDLDNSSSSEEWSEEFIKSTYNFERSPNKC